MIFPSEILNKIAFYSYNRYNCLQVCHYWLICFRPWAYKHIEIITRRQFKQFLQTINNKRHLGLNVKSLTIEYQVGISRDEFETLGIYFPSLEILDFNPKLWKYQRNTIKKKWQRILKLPPLNAVPLNLQLLDFYGTSLTDLKLSGCLVTKLHLNNQLISLFKSTPHLKFLKMFGRDKENITSLFGLQHVSFTLENLLSLHFLLPKLESLELLDFKFASCILENHVNVFCKIRKFCIQGTLAHYQWITMIAELYPHLRHLELKLCWDKEYKHTMTCHKIRQVEDGLYNIAKYCSYLETISLGSVLIKDGHILFYQALQKYKNVILNMDGVMIIHSAIELRNLTNAIIQCCDYTKTHTLRLQLWRDLGCIDSIILPISQYYQLKELELNCGEFSYSWNYGIDIDLIATHCPQLLMLKLTMTQMTLKNKCEQQDYTAKAINNVNSIELNKVHINTESMNALSILFPNLKHLKVLNCVKNKDDLEQKILIDLRSLVLKTLVIEKVYLRPSQYIEKSRIDIALFAIEKGGDVTRWYHLYNQKGTRQLKRLNLNQSNQLKSFKMNQKDWDCLEESYVRGTYRDFKYWKNDIPFGYIYITCNHSIHNLSINKVLV